MAKYEISEQQLNNLFVFLDRIKYEGLKEIQAINEIMNVLHNPINEPENSPQ